jgi:hypothetical protein
VSKSLKSNLRMVDLPADRYIWNKLAV